MHHRKKATCHVVPRRFYVFGTHRYWMKHRTPFGGGAWCRSWIQYACSGRWPRGELICVQSDNVDVEALYGELEARSSSLELIWIWVRAMSSVASDYADIVQGSPGLRSSSTQA